MILSPYSRVISLDDENVCLYNTVDRSLVALPKCVISGNEIDDSIGTSNIEMLANMGFFISDKDAETKGHAEIDNSHKLFISVELNRTCNLRCPYCYQGGDKRSPQLTEKDIDSLLRYCKLVLEKRPFTDLYLKVLGGEPTLAPDSFIKLHNKFAEFCMSRSIKYHLLIDTNGTCIDLFTSLHDYDSILFTIPLTHQKHHDKSRRNASGEGTYEVIKNNAVELYSALPNAKIVLRHNTDDENILLFEEYLDDIVKSVPFLPWISLNYTANMNGDDFKNELTYSDFIRWSSSEAIDHLLKRKLPILTSPLSSIEECQYRSTYSLKLFSDGTIGNCAMDFNKDNRLSLQELLSDFESNRQCSFLRRKESLSLSKDAECMTCGSLFLCGGTKKLPCIQAIEPGACSHNAAHNIDIDAFIRTYYFAKEKGLGDLFVVFEGKQGYR